MIRTVIGHLAADPSVVPAGQITITKFRILENVREFRNGTWVQDEEPIVHYVEAKFSLGDNAAVSLKKGDGVIVVGTEHMTVWGEGADKKHRVNIHATAIGPNLTRAIAQVIRTGRVDPGDETINTAENIPTSWAVAPIGQHRLSDDAAGS